MSNTYNIIFVSKFQFILDKVRDHFRSDEMSIALASEKKEVEDLLQNSFFHYIIFDDSMEYDEKESIKQFALKVDPEIKPIDHYGDINSISTSILEA